MTALVFWVAEGLDAPCVGDRATYHRCNGSRFERSGRVVEVAYFIGIACPWILIVILDRIAEGRRSAELAALGITPQPAAAGSAYLLKPDRPY